MKLQAVLMSSQGEKTGYSCSSEGRELQGTPKAATRLKATAPVGGSLVVEHTKGPCEPPEK